MSREIPTLMSAPMVRACLADTKSQTRRLVRWRTGVPPRRALWGLVDGAPDYLEWRDART